MKKYIYLIAGIAVLLLLSFISITINQKIALEKKWKVSEENVKAYSEQLSSSTNKNRALQLTVDQLNYFNDSIIEKLDSIRKELNVKDKQLKSLQYIASTFSKTDTLLIKGDTIFRDPTIAIDTIIGDKWYSIKLGFYYPSKVVVTPEVKSEKSVVISTKKETVNPPKKWWILRLFQKKHEVIQVDVVESNPYIKSDNSRYIEIVN